LSRLEFAQLPAVIDKANAERGAGWLNVTKVM
jgi:hypothetical protein